MGVTKGDHLLSEKGKAAVVDRDEDDSVYSFVFSKMIDDKGTPAVRVRRNSVQ